MAAEEFFLRKVSKLFKCYVLVKNFDRTPAISLKTLKIGFLTRFCDFIKVLGCCWSPKIFSLWLLESIYIFRLSRNPYAFLCFCYKICFFPKKLALTKTTSKDIAGYFQGLIYRVSHIKSDRVNKV